MSDTPKSTTSADSEEFTLLPDFCNARVILLTILTVELLAFVLALAPDVPRRERWLNLALISFFIQWIALANLVVLCVARRLLQRLHTTLVAVCTYVLILMVTFLASILALWLSPTHSLELSFDGLLGSDFIWRSMTISAIVSAVALRYFYVQHQWKQNVQAEARSRVQALQARIRPHFLFNSMNTIASLTRTDPAKAEQAVEDLADLFRASMMHQERIRLQDELEFTQRYVSIEQLRLGNRLTVTWNVDEDIVYDASVPPLTLQPLVENAIYHGIEPLADGGTVDISIDHDNGELAFEISNPVPQARGHQRRPGNQIAQDNIQQRLKLAYGERATMKINQAKDRYTVSFVIPDGASA